MLSPKVVTVKSEPKDAAMCCSNNKRCCLADSCQSAKSPNLRIIVLQRSKYQSRDRLDAKKTKYW